MDENSYLVKGEYFSDRCVSLRGKVVTSAQRYLLGISSTDSYCYTPLLDCIITKRNGIKEFTEIVDPMASGLTAIGVEYVRADTKRFFQYDGCDAVLQWLSQEIEYYAPEPLETSNIVAVRVETKEEKQERIKKEKQEREEEKQEAKRIQEEKKQELLAKKEEEKLQKAEEKKKTDQEKDERRKEKLQALLESLPQRSKESKADRNKRWASQKFNGNETRGCFKAVKNPTDAAIHYINATYPAIAAKLQRTTISRADKLLEGPSNCAVFSNKTDNPEVCEGWCYCVGDPNGYFVDRGSVSSNDIDVVLRWFAQFEREGGCVKSARVYNRRHRYDDDE